jgi:2-oxo-3-hexenedioate decarboxylase
MNVEDIANKAFAALGSERQITPFSTAYPNFSLENAYRVTAAVRAKREARGERPIGRKIGFTNRTIWAEYGVYAPIWGYVYDSRVRDLGGEPLKVSLSGLAEPRIEPEILFRLATRPKPGMDEQALIGCIDWIAHGFEIVQSIFPNWSFQTADTVAAYGLHGCSSSDPATRLNRGATSGRASSRASRSIFSGTGAGSITGLRPTSSTGRFSRCVISLRRWRETHSIHRSLRARS